MAQRLPDDSETNSQAQDSADDGVKLSRRKLAYVAPVLVSSAMFYGAAGCGKSNPRLVTCQALPRGAS